MNEIDFTCQPLSFEDFNHTDIVTKCLDNGISLTIKDDYNEFTGDYIADITMRDKDDVILTLLINGHLDGYNIDNEGKFTAKYVVETNFEGDIRNILSHRDDLERLFDKSA